MRAHTLTDAEIDGSTTKRTTRAKAGDTYPPRWIRLPSKGRCPETGFTRPALYALIASGQVKTACIRRPGTVRGQRFIYLPSLLSLLDRAATEEADRLASKARVKG